MKLSIAICTHNETEYINSLLDRLTKFIKVATSLTNNEYEIVILDDFSDAPTGHVLNTWANDYPELIYLYYHQLNNNFAVHKNTMNLFCTGDWILNLDADEWLPDDVLFNIPAIIDSNPSVDAYWLPRINTVSGLTLGHSVKWNWIITRLDGFRTATMRENLSDDEYGLLYGHALIIAEQEGMVVYDLPIIQFPDPQMRLYKNIPSIKWENPVHERLTGFTNFSHLPYEPEYAIRHEKDIKRQSEQNALYETLA